ncbi:MAG TPA: class E sortase [Nocardioides sp.]|nr:class E sortase [Nocardioides sp.]
MNDDIEDTEAEASADGVTRTRVRRSRPSSSSRSGGRGSSPTRARGGSRPLFLFGVGLILAGLAILSWVAWEFWGTNWVSQHRQEQVTSQLDKGWQSGQNTVHTKFGDAIAILHVPRFGSSYGVPVLEGDSESVLAAGIGHVPNTAEPGQVGNVVLAGHRVTHGEPFAKFPSLRKGDEVYVETRTTTYIYKLDNSGTDLIVPFTDTWVTQASPVNPSNGGVQPVPGSDHLITLFSCSEIFHTDNRSVVFGHLVGSQPRTTNDAPVAVPTQPAPADGGTSPWWYVAGGLLLAGLAWLLLRRRSAE